MNIIHRLTLKNMAQNRRRTLVTVLGAAVSVAMLTAVSLIAVSFLDMMQRTVLADTGDWHVRFEGVSSAAVDAVRADRQTAQVTTRGLLACAKPQDSLDAQRPYLALWGYDPADQSAARAPLTLEEGRLPQRAGELVVSRAFLETSALDWQVGQQVQLPTGWRLAPDEDSGELAPVAPSSPAVDEEQWLPEGSAGYTLVGVGSFSTSLEPSWGRSYTGITCLPAGYGGQLEVSASMEDPDRSVYDWGDRLWEQVGGARTYNSELLFYMGITDDNTLYNTLLGTLAIVCGVILVGSVSLIYNAFSISLAERSRTFGMLSSVGATRRQKRDSVFFEAALIGAAAIPLGLFAGWLGIKVTFACIGSTVQETFRSAQPLRVVVAPSAVGAAVLLSAAVLFLSAWLPARRASRISPIEAIRGSHQVRISPRQVRTSPVSRKLLGFEGELGLKNSKRSRSRYLATLLSLFVSVVLFLTASTFTYYMGRSFSMTVEDLQFDYTVNFSYESDSQRDQLSAGVQALPGIEESACTQNLYGHLTLRPEQLTAEARSAIWQRGDGLYPMGIQVYAMDEASLRQYCQRAGIEAAPLLSGSGKGILLSPQLYRDGHEFRELRHLQDPLGSELSFAAQEEGSPPLRLQIAGVSSETPMPVAGAMGNSSTLAVVVSQDTFAVWLDQMGTSSRSASVLVRAADPDLFYNRLLQYQKEIRSEWSVTDFSRYREQNSQLLLLVQVFVYGFVALVALVCGANIWNTVSTGVALRRREFAMLHSVGISPRGFRRMMRWESLSYGVKALALGLPVSALLAFGMYRVLERNFAFSFALPWGAYLAAVLGVFLLVGVPMALSLRKLRRENVMDALQNENL
ncbi:ABC transporter permease [Bittarella massiliensis (ex Durand et al. 2017)]|uniref:ABC transporter permease n=1 Tax=Bittarella massiliensis (ex Durand et al. 2017) TaxID=1720313 RepID=UPI001AA1C193|nr:ABC transporter permease [Bittarella massiliensis (ex Durand et al. 2017)]MBO1678745.1 ABC transporter permease [Bittarella massiliensis (ex Durand et al. 2017)]